MYLLQSLRIQVDKYIDWMNHLELFLDYNSKHNFLLPSKHDKEMDNND